MGLIKKKKLKLPFKIQEKKYCIKIPTEIPDSIKRMYYRDLFKKETQDFLNLIK